MDFLLLICLLGLTAFFSVSEAALFSLGKVGLNRLRLSTSSNRTEQILQRLMSAPRELLLAVLIGRELVQTALAIMCAWIVVTRWPALPVWGQLAIAIAVALPLLVIGEVTPRTLAASQAEPVARALARPVAAWWALVRPAARLLSGLTQVLLRRFGGSADDKGIDEDEFRALVDQGASEGVVEATEQALIRNVLDFDDLLVRDVMVPWEHVFTLPEDVRVSEAIAAVVQGRYSRIPLWRGDLRNVVGVLYSKDLLPQRWGLTPPRPLRQIMRRPFFVLPKMRADTLLETFRNRRIHMAVVVDEFGRALGVVTMEDLLEELFGPIADIAAERKGEDA